MASLRATLLLWVGLAGCAGAAGSDDPSDAFAFDGAVGALQDLATKPMDLAKTDGPNTSAGGSCNPNNHTLGANGGPDVCAYGKACSAVTSTCVPPPSGACAMSAGAPAWNQVGQVAPVITKITASLLATTNPTTECANGDPAALVTVEFYAPTFLTTTDSGNAFLQQVQFKKSESATGTWFDATFLRAAPIKNQNIGSFQVGINCGGAAGASKTAAVYVVDESARTSNVVCVSW